MGKVTLSARQKKGGRHGRVLRRDTAMDEIQNPARTPDIADLTALVEEIIAYWKELGRTRFNAQPGVDPDDFERLWLLLKTLGRVAPSQVVSRAKMRAEIENTAADGGVRAR